MTYEQATIARNTRNGRVLWQHVAAQLGCSVATARAQYDVAYCRPYAVATPAPPKPPAKPPRRRVNKPKPDGLSANIFAALADGPLSSKEIAEKSGRPYGSVRVRLSTLKELGLVDFVNCEWALPAEGSE